MSSHQHAPRAVPVVRLLTWAGLAVMVLVLTVCVGWRAQGGRWERVETPSMGRVAPVGTLLWVKPAPFASLRVGDFITFHPPGNTSITYSHRVFHRNADGTISTKGVLTAPDPWRLGPSDVVGKVAMHWWGVGWIFAAAPLLFLGGSLIGLVWWLAGAAWKIPAAILIGAVTISVALVWQRPLVNAQQLAFAPSGSGAGADATYVGTGLLPIRLSAQGGGAVVLHDGELGTVHVPTPDRHGRLRITLSPAIPLWWWVFLVGICFAPAVVATMADLRRRVSPGVRRSRRSRPRRSQARHAPGRAAVPRHAGRSGAHAV